MNEENIMLLLLEKSGRARGQMRGASEDSSKKVLVSNCVEYTTRTSSLPPMLSTDTKSGRDISRPHLIHRLHPTVMDFSPLPSPINSVKCPMGSSSSPPPPPPPLPPLLRPPFLPLFICFRQERGKQEGRKQEERRARENLT